MLGFLWAFNMGTKCVCGAVYGRPTWGVVWHRCGDLADESADPGRTDQLLSSVPRTRRSVYGRSGPHWVGRVFFRILIHQADDRHLPDVRLRSAPATPALGYHIRVGGAHTTVDSNRDMSPPYKHEPGSTVDCASNHLSVASYIYDARAGTVCLLGALLSK